MAMNASGHYDNLPDESPSKDKRKYSTRDLNGSYILACRGEESLENTAVEPLSPISNKSREKVCFEPKGETKVLLSDVGVSIHVKIFMLSFLIRSV